MFGYVICNKKNLTDEQTERYQSVYCGLCKELETRFGQLSRISLNYDMTFLIIFLSSLYEPEEKVRDFRCMLHPMKKKQTAINKFTGYAADMTIALSYYKCLDDWQDEHKHLQHQYAQKLESSYEEVKERWPRQCRKIETEIEILNKIEKSSDSLPDSAINSFGRVMEEIFVPEEDFWEGSLRNFGYNLGRFVYLMDAVIDYQKDLKTQNYNPLFSMQKKPKEMEASLQMLIGNAAREFEKLPMIQDTEIIRNIIYGGVWQQYYLKVIGKEKSDD